MTWPCPVCSSESARLFVAGVDYWIRGCKSCEHRFVEWRPSAEHVGEVFGDDYFQGGGAGYPNYHAEADILRRHGARYARILSQYMKPATVLDVGAAAGFISDGFRSQGWRPAGLEPNAQMVQSARNRGLEMHLGTLEDFRCGQDFDLISMIQVVQHFTDIRRAMKAAAQHCRTGGCCLVETWDNSSVSARLFGRHWHVYSPPSVLHYFSRRSLEHLCVQFGFTKIAEGRPVKCLSCGHAKSLILHHLGQRWLSAWLAPLPDRLYLRYPANDVFWMLFQRQANNNC